MGWCFGSGTYTLVFLRLSAPVHIGLLGAFANPSCYSCFFFIIIIIIFFFLHGTFAYQQELHPWEAKPVASSPPG